MPQNIALLYKNARKGFGAVFPDFPGCVSVSKTIEDAMREAAETLAFHVDGMREDGLKIPRPRSVEAIRQAREEWIDMDDAIVAAISLLPPQGKPFAFRSRWTTDCLPALTLLPKIGVHFSPGPHYTCLKTATINSSGQQRNILARIVSGVFATKTARPPCSSADSEQS